MYERDLTEYKDTLSVGDKFVFRDAHLCDVKEQTLKGLACEVQKILSQFGTYYLEIISIREF